MNYEKLERHIEQYRTKFRNGKPFKNIVIDGLYTESTAEVIYDHFPPMDLMNIRFKARHEYKAALSDLACCHVSIQKAYGELLSDRFVNILSQITEVPALITDPNNIGGGVHQSSHGMYLDVHADFNYHPTNGLHRKLNVLIYFNKDWLEEYGGCLELWDRHMKRCEKKITPTFNRCVIFETSNHTFHGYNKIVLPEGMTRKSFSAYYYLDDKSTERAHSTLWQKRPEDKVWMKYLNKYKLHFGQLLGGKGPKES